MKLKIKPKSELISILLLSFGFIIILLLFFAYSSKQQMDESYKLIQGSARASDKMEIISQLVESARSRTRLTMQMIYEKDPFEKDEINIELDVLANKFSRARQQLIELGLNEIESEIIKKQNKVILSTLALQRQAAEMAMSDDPAQVKEAEKILLEQVYTGQGFIIDYFIKLETYQKSIIDQSRNAASEHYQRANQVQVTLLLVILTLAVFVMLYVVRKTTSTEKELFLEKEKAQITLKSVGDAVITTDNEGIVSYLNPVAEKLTGHMAHSVIGSPINKVFKAFDDKNERWLGECIINFLHKGIYSMPSNDIILYDIEGNTIDILLTIAPIQDLEDHVLGTITTFQDITKEKTLAKRIEHQARHDALTGLLNRREFETKVEQSLRLYSEGSTHALCVIDLDRFKIVNDTAGHTAGDELLRQISQRMKEVLRKTDFLARIGGDEFALFLSNIGVKQAEEITEKILSVVRDYQFLWSGKAFKIGASIGLVDAPAKVSSYENLYHAADAACYMAKHEGRDRVHIVTYDDHNVAEKREQTQWVNRINDALDMDRFVLYAQDIVPLSNDPSLKPHKEVLIRMLDVDGKIVPPMAFIPPAERYNLMSKLDSWVIHTVIDLIKEDHSDTIYGINLSGQSLADSKFTTSTLQLISSCGVELSRLCFEITETAAIDNLENANNFLLNLQQLGCFTALDDFGSGLSSFAYLRNMPINYLKIDGMFVRQISKDPTSRVMVEAIHAIASTMNLKTIAEFVEDEEIRDQLIDIGIDYAQGYYFGAPEPV